MSYSRNDRLFGKSPLVPFFFHGSTWVEIWKKIVYLDNQFFPRKLNQYKLDSEQVALLPIM